MSVVVDLSGGEMAIAPPIEPLSQLGSELAELGTAYAPREGRDVLRARLHALFACGPEEDLVVTSGASLGLTAALRVLCSAREPVLIPDCCYPGFGAIATLLDLRCVRYTLGQPLPQAARGARCVVLNSPHNPTGRTISPSDLDWLLDRCRAQGCTLLLDEVYADFDVDHRFLIETLRRANVPVIRVGSLSKGLAMAGWRLGYAVADGNTCQRLSRAHFALAMSASAPAQRAAEAILDWPGLPRWRTEFAERLAGRRASTREKLGRAGFAVEAGCLPFLWVGCDERLAGRADFVNLAMRAGVGLAAGDQFEGAPSRRFRLNLAAASDADFHAAVDRLCRLHETIRTRVLR